jgi:hypothetical protein
MHPGNPYQVQAALAQVQQHLAGAEFQATCDAARLFERVRTQVWLWRLWSTLSGRPRYLYDLELIKTYCTVHGRCYAGVGMVPICQIRGSEGQHKNYDTGFRPLRSHNMSRWVSVAVAWLTGTDLPPIRLIRAGDVFFVRDGHHRVSVARALGLKRIRAEVVVWDVAGPLPWERTVAAVDTVHQPA